ncbi:MAG TPA: iron-containing alcohol dehydrogenase family protein [Thermotogota bacterium]|nr:iron-containing alcohol dehydrogenase family protein [Thermotogota bacterium]HPJ88955.1 iron-containing alcohol dehydrogenase family protein [Thermotogota bacterium]HPR95907.1 iron-containing alcohol dehydrogenase family protein [Thermotogota bacterium]
MWKYDIPVKLFQGEKCVLKNGSVFSLFGNKAFIVTGKHSAKASGALDDVLGVLRGMGIAYTLFDDVEENPSFATVEAGARKMAEEQATFCIVIGGGSPLDAGKAMSALAKNQGYKPEDLFIDPNPSAFPIIAIPTTSGTGSEITPYSILTDRFNNKVGFASQYIFPVYSFLDPRYTFTMPRSITVSTAIDALSHAVEGELKDFGENPMIQMYAHKANQLIKDNLMKLDRHPRDFQVREAIQNASLYAGIVITHYGTTIIHSAGYPLSSFRGIKHGIANGLFMTDVLRRVEETHPERVRNCIHPFKHLDEVEEWLNAFDVFEKVEMSEGEIKTWARMTMNSQKKKKTPGDFDIDFFEGLFRKIAE